MGGRVHGTKVRLMKTTLKSPLARAAYSEMLREIKTAYQEMKDDIEPGIPLVDLVQLKWAATMNRVTMIANAIEKAVEIEHKEQQNAQIVENIRSVQDEDIDDEYDFHCGKKH